MLRRIEDKKEKRRKFWMGAVLTFLMIFSLAGILVGSLNTGASEFEYNGFEFQSNGNSYYTEINDVMYGFNFLPQQLSNINYSPEVKQYINVPNMYVTFNPNQEQQRLLFVDIVRNDLQLNFGTYTINGITENSNIYLLPIITCDNATQMPVLYLNQSNTTSIKVENGCIIANADLTEWFKIRDLLMYLRLGVIGE